MGNGPPMGKATDALMGGVTVTRDYRRVGLGGVTLCILDSVPALGGGSSRNGQAAVPHMSRAEAAPLAWVRRGDPLYRPRLWRMGAHGAICDLRGRT